MKNESLSSPQLVIREQSGVAVDLSHKQILSLFKKSEQSGHSFDVLKEVYQRGFSTDFSEQTAFNRVNSFIAGGAAAEMDKDLIEKRGLWDNIHAKRERIKHGSGEHMRKPRSKGAPTDAAIKASQTEDADPCWTNYKQVGMKTKNGKQVPNCVPNESYTGAETKSNNPNNPSNRFDGTTSLTNNYKKSTPGESTLKTIKKVVKEVNEDAKGYKNPTGGLTQKGRDHYNRESGGHLKAPVTTPPSKLKAGSKSANRRKSFCARMGGVEGPMKDEKGRPTRKALALRKWNC